MTSLGLYFDDVAFPLTRKRRSESFLRLLSALPKAERDFISRNSNFYNKYKSLDNNIFNFINPLSEDDLVNSVLGIYEKLPETTDRKKYHVLSLQQHAYGAGYFKGKSHAAQNAGKEKVILPFSYSVENFAIPNNITTDTNFADIVASIIAVEAIQISLPDLQAVHPDEILWAREKLGDELIPFRMSMYRLAKSIRALIDEKPSIDTIKSEATFLVKTTLLPDVLIFRERIAQENKSFARKIVVKSLDTFKLAINYLVSPDPIKLAAFTTEAVSGLINYSEYRDKVNSLNLETAVSYLAKLSDLLPAKSPT